MAPIRAILAAAALAAAPVATAFFEKETGARFPDRLTQEGVTLQPTGAGVREKLWVNVYAAALYVDPRGMRQRLAEHRLHLGEGLIENERFYAEVVRADVPKALVIRTLRDVSAEDMQEALEEGLAKSIEIDDAARRFIGQLVAPLPAGSTVRFDWMRGGRARMAVGESAGPVYENPALSRALQKIWLGPDPVSREMRADLVRRLPGMLR